MILTERQKHVLVAVHNLGNPLTGATTAEVRAAVNDVERAAGHRRFLASTQDVGRALRVLADPIRQCASPAYDRPALVGAVAQGPYRWRLTTPGAVEAAALTDEIPQAATA